MEMFFCLLFFFLCFHPIQSLDYGITNQQICTRKPFAVLSPHNCSRRRLKDTITEPNDDSLIPITIFFDNKTSVNTSLFVKKSTFDRRLNLTIVASSPRIVYLNRRGPIYINQSRFVTYLYDSLNDTFVGKSAFTLSGPDSSTRICLLRDPLITPVKQSSRIYYLYTNENYLEIDLTQSPADISPLFNAFNNCFRNKSTVSSLGIALIVIVSVLSVITTVLIIFWLKRQIKQLYHIWRNWVRSRLGLTPETHVSDQPPMTNSN